MAEPLIGKPEAVHAAAVVARQVEMHAASVVTVPDVPIRCKPPP